MVEKPTTSSMSPPLKLEDLFLSMEAAGGSMRYVYSLQARKGPSVWISTHMVHERMETKIGSKENQYLAHNSQNY